MTTPTPDDPNPRPLRHSRRPAHRRPRRGAPRGRPRDRPRRHHRRRPRHRPPHRPRRPHPPQRHRPRPGQKLRRGSRTPGDRRLLHHPELTKHGRGERVHRYHGRVNITAELVDFTALGELTTRLADLDLTRVDGPWWALRPDSPVHRQARQQAVREAVQRAREYAEALGTTLAALVELADIGAENAQPYGAPRPVCAPCPSPAAEARTPPPRPSTSNPSGSTSTPRSTRASRWHPRAFDMHPQFGDSNAHWSTPSHIQALSITLHPKVVE